MIIRIFFRPVFSFQLNLNNTDGVATIRRTPITIISIDKIINTFIIKLFYQLLFLFARLWFRGAWLIAEGMGIVFLFLINMMVINVLFRLFQSNLIFHLPNDKYCHFLISVKQDRFFDRYGNTIQTFHLVGVIQYF